MDQVNPMQRAAEILADTLMRDEWALPGRPGDSICRQALINAIQSITTECIFDTNQAIGVIESAGIQGRYTFALNFDKPTGKAGVPAYVKKLTKKETPTKKAVRIVNKSKEERVPAADLCRQTGFLD